MCGWKGEGEGEDDGVREREGEEGGEGEGAVGGTRSLELTTTLIAPHKLLGATTHKCVTAYHAIRDPMPDCDRALRYSPR
jgi:hypothetical protein